MEIKNKTVETKGDYINGRFVKKSAPDAVWKIVSPADQDDTVFEGHASFVSIEEACVGAKKAFLKWSTMTMDQRKEPLLKLKKIFQDRALEMATLISRETGKPLWETKTESAALAAKIDVTLEHSLKLVADERISQALPGVDGVVRFKPRGVMAVVGPFNFPAHLPNGHIIPALIAGNTIVFKPSDKTPGVGQLYTEMIHEAGFPDGVFQMVQGQGETGRRLVIDENVDGILFTGSYEVGLKIKKDTLDQYWKILALEMGGKNSTIVWDDADIEKALYETLVGAFMSSGQRCSCTSKVILHKTIAEKFLKLFHESAKKIEIGHWSKNVFMGPLISQDSVDRYVRFQDIAVREGAESIMRGKYLEMSPRGHYVSPSIHRVNKHNPESVYQKTELFAPNVAVYTVSDLDEAIEIVNAGGFGLAGALFTKTEANYHHVLQRARLGLLNWNRTTNGASSRLPFGGLGKSGNDRPSGHFAIQYCTVPIASLEDGGKFDATKVLPGIHMPKD
jgi:succinylglutamic semialdehyde dehydrogenase